MRRIKAWGCTHADEIPAIEAARSLMDDPIPGVEAGIVNLEALRLNRRWVDINMNAGYPGDRHSPNYEERRAVEVLRESQGYYAVVDLHNNNGHGEDTASIGSHGVHPEVLGFLAHLGLKKLVLTAHNTLHDHVANGFLLEFVTTSERSAVPYIREALGYLATAKTLPQARAADFLWFAFLDDIRVEDMHPSELPAGLAGFDKVPDDVAAKMGHPDEAVHMLGWGDEPNAQGYWAEVCTPIPPPDDTNWPLH